MTWKNETTRQPLPAPLPMYEPVRLKHVPTIVRRRYDRDLKTFKYPNEGLPLEGKSDGDGVEDNDDPTFLGDVGDSVGDNEVEDDYHANFDTEHDTESNMEDFGSNNIESSSSTYNGDSKIKNDKDQDAIDISSYVDSNLEDNTQNQSWQSNATSDMNDHGSNLIDEKDEIVSTSIEYVNANFKNEVQDNEQGLYVVSDGQDNKIDDDGAKDGIVNDGIIRDEVQDDVEHGNFDKERQGLPEEDDKSEGDKAEYVIHDATAPNLDDSVDYVAKDDEQQANNFVTKHDIHEDTSVDNGAHHNEQAAYVGFPEQDNNINDEGTNDGIVASSYENGSDQDKVEDDEHENLDKEQAFSEEDDISEGNRAEDVIHDSAGLDLDNSVEYEVEDDAQTKFDTKLDERSYTSTEHSDTNNLEETKFEGEIQQRDGASSVEASVEDSIKNDGHENPNINHQDFEEEEEDGHNNDVSIDTSVNSGDHSDQHNEKGLRMEDCATEDSGSMNAHVIESKDNGHGNFDDKQGIYQAQSSSFALTPWLARQSIQVQWVPSPLNFHKLINFAGLSTSSTKVGIIIRDAHGAILSAKVYKMGAISPILAEAWALRNGLLQANKLGCSNHCSEGDTRLHIRMISRDYQCPWNLQFLVEDSKHFH